MGYTTEAAAGQGTAYAALQDSAPNRWIKGPKSLDHRYLHEDVELQDYPEIPGATWHVGYQGALQWTPNLWESFGNFRLEPQECIHAGRGRFVCVTGTVGQGRRSGLQVSLTAYAIVTVEDGKVRRIGITVDRQEALRAVGLLE